MTLGSRRSAGFAPIKATDRPESNRRAFSSLQRRFEASSFCTRATKRARLACGEFITQLLRIDGRVLCRLDGWPVLPVSTGTNPFGWQTSLADPMLNIPPSIAQAPNAGPMHSNFGKYATPAESPTALLRTP